MLPAADVGDGPSSLDSRTQLVGGVNNRRSVTVYPTAGEATGAWVPAERPEIKVPKGSPPDVIANRCRSGRRARGRARRYCVANTCDRLWTFTFDDSLGPAPSSRAECDRHAKALVRRLRAAGLLPSGTPYLVTLERGKLNGRWHIHFAFAEWMPVLRARSAWGLGRVDCGRAPMRHRGRHGAAPAVNQARWVASYVAKYVGKDFDDTTPGLHRYEVGQGCQPEMVKFTSTTEVESIAQAIALIPDGNSVQTLARSAEWDDWKAPPAWKMVWIADG